MTNGREARRRRREFFLIGLVCCVFCLLTVVEYTLGRTRSDLPFNEFLLFFSIININIVLMLLMIFLIVRNVVKLVC